MMQPMATNRKVLVVGVLALVLLIVWYRIGLKDTGTPTRGDKPGSSPATVNQSKWIQQCPGCFIADYEVVLDIPDLCVDTGVTLVIVIHVNSEKFVAREIIRNTWLSEVRNNSSLKHVRYFFLLGKPESASVRDDVKDEWRMYGDIVLYNFEDTYKNLTIKTVLAMQWIYSRCPNTKYFFKTDDDVWVNVTNLLATIQNYGKQLEKALGGVCRRVKVVRDTASKWHATYQEFPRDVYDPYCSGTGYLGGIAVAKGVVSVYTQVPYFHLEDVFMGMCLKLIGYQTKFLQHFDNTRGPGLEECAIRLGDYVTVHKVSGTKMMEIFRRHC